MTIKVLSDTALVIEVADSPGGATLADIQALTAWLTEQGWARGAEIVPALTAVAVHFPPTADILAARAGLAACLGEDDTPMATAAIAPPRQRVLPVVYGGAHGPDLARVAGQAGLSPEEVVRRHAGGTYRVLALGFAPGFPYLSGLDPALACPRLDSPRLRVPVGAVGIGGAQTGVYPQELPGGWNLIGRTPQRLFDAAAGSPSWLEVGDEVRFAATDDAEGFDAPTPVETAGQPETAGIEVREGGVQTTVQDFGRPGFQALGVAEGGAVNRRALEVANLLVGNPPGVAGLEFVLRGPVLRFRRRVLVALAGACPEPLPPGRPFWVDEGAELDLRRLAGGGWGYLAVAGGLPVPMRMQSASTHLAARFGGFAGRAVREGDVLPLAPSPFREVGSGWRVSAKMVGAKAEEPTEIRVVRGPEAEWFGAAAWQTFLEADYRLTADSNRMGFRFEGPALPTDASLEMISQPVALGTIQIPPNGLPMILMADRQSVGGYPRLGSVVRADIGTLAQVPPGGAVRFTEVTLAEAQAARIRANRDLGLLAAGLHGRVRSRK